MSRTLYEKIVERRRGGFCHELAQLFFWLLGQVGLRVTLLGTETTFFHDGRTHPPLSHELLLVDCPGSAYQRWLVDVGFGWRSPRVPLLLDTPSEQSDGLTRYRLDSSDGLHTLIGHHLGVWQPLYSFTTEPRRP